jgi:rhodanese-related sulfurtransferase
MLIDRGYLKVRPLAGGLDAWAEAGYTIAMIERGAQGGPA